MKRAELKQHIADFIPEGTEKGQVDEKALMIHLLTEVDGVMPSDIKQIHTILVELGYKDKIVKMDSAQKKLVQKACTKKALKEITSHKDMREFAESIESDLTDKDTLKVVAATMREKGFTVPRKVRLGTIKEAVVDYFINTPEDKTSTKGLAEFIKENVEISGTPIGEDKAEKVAMSNYTFAYMLWTHQNIDDVN